MTHWLMLSTERTKARKDKSSEARPPEEHKCLFSSLGEYWLVHQRQSSDAAARSLAVKYDGISGG